MKLEASGDESMKFLFSEDIEDLQRESGFHAQTGKLWKTEIQLMNTLATEFLQLAVMKTSEVPMEHPSHPSNCPCFLAFSPLPFQ